MVKVSLHTLTNGKSSPNGQIEVCLKAQKQNCSTTQMCVTDLKFLSLIVLNPHEKQPNSSA